MFQVFVGGMPYSYSRDQVAEYWGWCGEVESLDMLTFPDTGRFRWVHSHATSTCDKQLAGTIAAF